MKLDRSIALLLLVAANALAGETVTINGVTYEDVTWGNVTHTSVTIYHKTGVATIPLNRLPPELRQRLGHVPHPSAVTATNTSSAKAVAAPVEPSRADSDGFTPSPLNTRFEERMAGLLVAFGLYVAALLWVNRAAQAIGARKRLWNTVALVLNVPGILVFAAVYGCKQRKRAAEIGRAHV